MISLVVVVVSSVVVIIIIIIIWLLLLKTKLHQKCDTRGILAHQHPDQLYVHTPLVPKAHKLVGDFGQLLFQIPFLLAQGVHFRAELADLCSEVPRHAVLNEVAERIFCPNKDSAQLLARIAQHMLVRVDVPYALGQEVLNRRLARF